MIYNLKGLACVDNKIIGVDINKYPRFYKSINRVMVLYHFNKLFVYLHDENCGGHKILLGATSGYTKGWKTIFMKTIVTTKPTVEFIENSLSDDEIDCLIGHEFGHIKNHDVTKLKIPIIMMILLWGAGTIALIHYLYIVHFWTGCVIADLFMICVTLYVLYLPLVSVPKNLYGLYILPALTLRCEQQADTESLQHVKKPDSLKSALIKYIEKMNSSNQYTKLLFPLELRLKRIDDHRVK